jgi:hypothetical protein
MWSSTMLRTDASLCRAPGGRLLTSSRSTWAMATLISECRMRVCLLCIPVAGFTTHAGHVQLRDNH